MSLLSEKVCIITGAARGIGKEIAILFADQGAEVIINDIRDGAADDWVKEHPLKKQFYPYYFDITKPR